MDLTQVDKRHPEAALMQEKYWFLKNCSLFDKISDERLNWLESRSRVRRFARNSPVYLPVDHADGVLLLGEGRVKICSVTPEGKQSILTFIEPGELFGELALFDSGEREEYAETIERSTIVMIPADAMTAIVEQSPTLAVGITRLVGFRRRRIQRRLKNLLFRSNRERLVHLILELAEDYGVPSANGDVSLAIRLSHQDLASVIGSTRESVTVILGQLQAQGLLTLGRRRIVIRSLEWLARSVQAPTPTLRRGQTNAATSRLAAFGSLMF